VQSAAILAGGQATRFGGLDKSALTVDGRTILDRQVAELSPLTSDLLIVGERTHHAAARTIADVVPGCGPLGGLHAALTHARGNAVFLIACDMPYVTTAFIAHLLQFASEADIVVPQTERGYHPLCAVYTRACLEPVARRLADRQLRIRELVADMRTHVVTAEEIDRFGHRHRLLANVNTPAEHAGLEALRSHEL
jgi:molybdopterin-guanine dinucleotide biosynthesis protein A